MHRNATKGILGSHAYWAEYTISSFKPTCRTVKIDALADIAIKRNGSVLTKLVYLPLVVRDDGCVAALGCLMITLDLAADHGMASGPMGEAADRSFSKLVPEDISAVATSPRQIWSIAARPAAGAPAHRTEPAIKLPRSHQEIVNFCAKLL